GCSLFGSEDSRMAEAQTHVFRVSLSPKVYRDFEILSAKNLYDLAGDIVRVFGFDFDHAFGFYSKLTGDVFGSPVKYELFADMGESDARSVKRNASCSVLWSTSSVHFTNSQQSKRVKRLLPRKSKYSA